MLFVCSFFHAFMFWKYLPIQLIAIQFPYRLLMLATTFGTILAGLIMTEVTRQRRMVLQKVFVAAFIILLAGFWWRPSVSGTHFSDAENVGFAGSGVDYFEFDGSRPIPTDRPQISRQSIKVHGNSVSAIITSDQERDFVFPVQYSYRLTAQVNGSATSIANANGQVSISLLAGKSDIKIQRDEPIGFLIGPCVAVILTILAVIRLRRDRPIRQE
jgi:hypothetical protein